MDTSMKMTQGDILILVDMQIDFLPGGALGVTDGDEIVPVLNQYIAAFRAQGLPVVASRDWHPANHCSFQDQGGQWPTHCVQGSPGAEFAPGLNLPPESLIVSKADRQERDAYSCFSGTDLDRQLQALGAKRLFCGGLATDYCVLASVVDALELGYQVVLLEDAIRAVDLEPGDGEAAIRRMLQMGAQPINRGLLAA